MSSLWHGLVDAICRPPRDDAYSPDDLVGGRSGRFSAAGKSYTRRDFSLTNRRQQMVLCSLFEGRTGAGGAAFAPSSSFASSSTSPSSPNPAPVVIYAHCNSGSRRDAEEVMGLLLPAGIAVAALDFSGSGLSDGAHVSLGAFEAEDLADLVDFLVKERGKECRIAIWGRSMGAVAALLAAAAEAREAAAEAETVPPSPSTLLSSSPKKTNTRIAAVVLDSPFSSLPELMAELVAKQRLLPLPRALLSSKGLLLKIMARSVQKRAGFDLRAVVPVKAVSGAGFLGSSSSRASSSKASKAPARSSSNSDGASAEEGRRGLFASLLPPALFGHAEADSFIAPRHSRVLHGCYLGSEKALCAFGGDHNSARPASFRSAALGFLKEVLFPGEGGAGGGGEMRRAAATAASAATALDDYDKTKTNLTSFASLGAATAFDAALSAAAPDHHSSGDVASGHARDERESWGRSAAAFASSSTLASWHPTGGNGTAAAEDDEDEELLEMERAIAASLELSCADAEREAQEAREAALAAADAAAAAAEQLRGQREEREREREQLQAATAAAAAVTHRSSFALPPASSLLETTAATAAAAAAAAVASFDLTPDQRELHAFFSPPSPTAAAEKSRQERRRPAAAAAAATNSKRPLSLPKAPPVVPSSVPAASSRKNVEAQAGGWKS